MTPESSSESSLTVFIIYMDTVTHQLYSCSFFLEKNMQQFFLKILSQKCGRFVCLQLLQTLSILFENIRNETSICESAYLYIVVYCLLSWVSIFVKF